MKASRILTGIAVIIVLPVCVWCSRGLHADVRPQIDFFSAALKKHSAVEQVWVHDKLFTVIDGNVTSGGNAVSPRDTFDALRLTYAVTMARRQPLFVIPEVNPYDLDKTTDELAATRERLASIQQNWSDARSVRNDLYPIDFLRALAARERARLQFIASGSDTDELAYARSRNDVVKTYIHDLDAFEDSFKRIVPQNAATYQVFEGAVTHDSILASIARMRAGFAENNALLEKRDRCIAGEISFCNPEAELNVPLPSIATSSTRIVSPLIADEISSALDAATGKSGYLEGQKIELTNSVCLKQMNIDPVFTLVERDQSARTELGPEFVGDAMFIPSARYPSIPYYKFYGDKQVRYVYFPIFETYKCPELVTDISGVIHSSLVRQASLSIQFSRYANGSRDNELRKGEHNLATLLRIRQSDALTYVRDVILSQGLQRRVPRDDMNRAYDLALAANNATAGLTQFIRRTLKDEAANLGLLQEGVPVEMDAEYLFYVRSGYFSLFQATNPSVSGMQTPPVDPTQESNEAPFLLYSDLRETVSKTELARDIGVFFQLHKTASLSVPTQ